MAKGGSVSVNHGRVKAFSCSKKEDAFRISNFILSPNPIPLLLLGFLLLSSLVYDTHYPLPSNQQIPLSSSLYLFINNLLSSSSPHHRFSFSTYPTPNNIMTTHLSPLQQEQLIEKLEIFKIHGKDKHGRKILRILGKFFPARTLTVEALKKYLEENIFPRLCNKPFSVLYVHTGVQRSENFPGISALRSVHEAIPVNVKDNLHAIYFVHPGLQARLFLATFGRFLFSGGLYGKLRYVGRIDYLWEHLRRNEVEIPEFVSDHDEDLEYRPMMDYGLESDLPRVHGAPAVDSPVSLYSMRCIS